MRGREPHEAGKHLPHLCIDRSWSCPWQVLEEPKEKLDILKEIQPYKQLTKVGKV